MKKLNILFIVLLTVIGFTACEDVKDPVINPEALNGSLSFKLNESRYANATYALEDANATSDMDALTCVQPAYGFNAAVTYTTQVCADALFKEGKYVSLATTVSGEKVGVNTKEMNKALISLFDKSIVVRTVYVRLKAMVSDATASPLDQTLTVKPLYSNSIKLKVLPYEFPLFPYTEITPTPYYIVGLGDGAWNNSNAGLGKSLIPMSVVPGKKYDLSGNGEFTFTGYFQKSRGFKLIRDIGGWSEQWGMTGGVFTHNTGDNIFVPADGFYTLTLNSIDNTLTMVKATITPASYTQMGLIGAFNGWGGDEVMTAVETTNNHVWYKTMTFASDDNYLFRANGSWDFKFGAPSTEKGDPLYQKVGIGMLGAGSDILQKAGTYVMIINDIDGCYWAIKL